MSKPFSALKKCMSWFAAASCVGVLQMHVVHAQVHAQAQIQIAQAQMQVAAAQPPVRIWVGAPAGGTTDTMARALARELGR